MEDKLSKEKLVKALHVPEETVSPEKAKETILCHLKPNKLHNNLVAYIRAQSLIMYEGPDVTSIKMLEPCDIEYEILVLTVYKEILNGVYEDNPERFEIFEGDTKAGMAPHRKEFIKTYKAE